MHHPTVDADLVARICRDATARSGGTAVEVVRDHPFDDTTWVRMSSRPCAREALTGLNSYSVSGHDLEDGWLHVSGWDVRLLHWRLGALRSVSMTSRPNGRHRQLPPLTAGSPPASTPTRPMRHGDPAAAAQKDIGQSLASTRRESSPLTRNRFMCMVQIPSCTHRLMKQSPP